MTPLKVPASHKHNLKLEMRSMEHSVEHGICLQLIISKTATGRGNFGHSSINKHDIAQFFAHAQHGHNSTSSLKSDVKIVYLHPDFRRDTKILEICIHLRQI